MTSRSQNRFLSIISLFIIVSALLSFSGCASKGDLNSFYKDELKDFTTTEYKSVIFGYWDGPGRLFIDNRIEFNYPQKSVYPENYFLFGSSEYPFKYLNSKHLKAIYLWSHGGTYDPKFFWTPGFLYSAIDLDIYVPVDALVYIGCYKQKDKKTIELLDQIEKDLEIFKHKMPKIFSHFKGNIYNAVSDKWYKKR